MFHAHTTRPQKILHVISGPKGVQIFKRSEMSSSRYREWDLSCKVYVGNLGTNASKYDIEKVFAKYGNIRNVWVARNPPGFAFVEFEDPRDAEDATRGLDGTRCCGTRIRVEMSNGRTRREHRSILSTNHQHTNDLTTSLHHNGSFAKSTSANAARHFLNFCRRLSVLLRASAVSNCAPITVLAAVT
ncbi:RNA-binding protein, partial [Operophtera brumata]